MSAHVVRNPVPTTEETAEILGVGPERVQAIRDIMSPMVVERTAQGSYAVRKLSSASIYGVFATQAEAIHCDRELDPDSHPLIERVRNVNGATSSKWRRAS
jgi:hypothetical protein